MVDATRKGVLSSYLVDQLANLAATDYVILRKPRPFLDSLELQGPLLDASYYFYMEHYDGRGLARAIRPTVVRVGASICSVFVKKVLIRSGEVPAEHWSRYSDHIFPGELFELLKEQGYEEARRIVVQEPGRKTPLHLPSMDESQKHSNDLTDLINSMPNYSGRLHELFDWMEDSAAIKYLLIVSGNSIFQMLEHALNGVVLASENLERAGEIEKNWRDQQRRKKSIDVSLDRLQREGEDYCRLNQAVSVALQSPGLLESFAKLNQLKGPDQISSEDADELMRDAYSNACRALASIIQMTGCKSIEELRTASASVGV
jgi:hypothetical protein